MPVCTMYNNINNMSNILSAGCVQSDDCRASIIGDQLCSVGSGMQCQCEHPKITGNDSICYDGMLCCVDEQVLGQ